jgi:hypothetical protein
MIMLVCVPLSAAGTEREIAADANSMVQGDTGPVIYFDYGPETVNETPISSFLYFIPLVAMTPVERQTSPDHQQRVRMISCQRQRTLASFFTTCEFEIVGEGFHRDVFDPEDMIAFYKEEIKEGQTLLYMLDYILFKGQGFVRVEIMGTTTGSVDTVTQVDVYFNGRGYKSPVTIGLYDVRPVDGKYKYENRSNQMVVRVNRLTFKRTEGVPVMGVGVATLGRSAEEEGLWPTVKGMIANLLIRPPRIDPLGNEAMLNFGAAIQMQKPSFTLPKADKIKTGKPGILSSSRGREQFVQRRQDSKQIE